MRRFVALLMLVLLCLQSPALQAAPGCCDDCPATLLCAVNGACPACAMPALPSAAVLPAASHGDRQAGARAWTPKPAQDIGIWRPPWRNGETPLFIPSTESRSSS